MYYIDQNLTLLQIESHLITINNHFIITEPKTAHITKLNQTITLAHHNEVDNKIIGSQRQAIIETSGTFKSKQRQVTGGKDECIARWAAAAE